MNTELLESLMVNAPGAMLPVGHAMATQGDLEGLQRWLDVLVDHRWEGVMHPDPTDIVPMNISVSSRDATGRTVMAVVPTTTATILAEALVHNTYPGLTPVEEKLLGTYLQAAGKIAAQDVLREELVWALCRRVDREGPLRAALAAFPAWSSEMSFARLSRHDREYGLYPLDTALNVAMSGQEGRPRAFLTLCEHFDPTAAATGHESNSPIGTSLGRLAGSFTAGVGNTWRKIWERLLAGPQVIEGLRVVQAIERWGPVDANRPSKASESRHAIAALHLQGSANRGLPWREDVIRFVLGDLDEVTDGPSRLRQTPEEMARARWPVDLDDSVDCRTSQLLATALAAHCAPVLELLEPLVRTLSTQPVILQLGRGPLHLSMLPRAKPPDVYPTPLMYVVRGASEAQPADEVRLDDTLGVLERFGLMDSEHAPNVRTAMHLVAQTADLDRARWLVKLVDLGLNPEGQDASGRKPAALMADKGDKELWNNVLRSLKARHRASEALAEIADVDGLKTDVTPQGFSDPVAKKKRRP